MKGPREGETVPAGPQRWSFRQYVISGHASPRGHRFDIHGPQGQLVAVCRMRRGESDVSFAGDGDGREELFRLHAKQVRQFAVAYDVIDARSQRPIGELRKKEYKTLDKSEWFIFSPEGEALGMVVEAAPKPSLLRQLVPLESMFRKSWQLHWGQQIAGYIRPRAKLLGDQAVVSLEMDTKDVIDRRLALGLAVLVHAELPAAP